MLKTEEGTKIPLSVFIFKFKNKREYNNNKNRYIPSKVSYELVTDKEKQAVLTEYCTFVNENVEYVYYKGEIKLDISLYTLLDEIEVGTYIRIEIHGLINPHFYFENTIKTVFIE
jgi:LPS O-antigen subunit length determinant protein (WzzB/FepE family)